MTANAMKTVVETRIVRDEKLLRSRHTRKSTLADICRLYTSSSDKAVHNQQTAVLIDAMILGSMLVVRHESSLLTLAV